MPNPLTRLSRGQTHVDFAGQWRKWFAISGTVILIGLISLGVRGLNFSVDFKGGTIWQVPTSASVSQVSTAIDKVSSSLSQAQIQVQTDRQSGQRTIQVEADTKVGNNAKLITGVSSALAQLGHVSTNDVNVQSVGAAWGSSITSKAIKAVIVFLVVVTIYIWFRFEGKMALAALVALVHDILVTVGIYSLSGFQVSPDTVIAFLTILGYSLYDTIVVFDKVQENTRSLASSNRSTYTDVVNTSMNQVLARSLNTSFVAIIPILSILVIGSGVLGASSLNDFGLALFIGLVTGAYSSIFIASPLLGLLKEREPRYREIRRRIAEGGGTRPVAPGRRRSSGGPGARSGGRGRPGRPRDVAASASIDDYQDEPPFPPAVIDPTPIPPTAPESADTDVVAPSPAVAPRAGRPVRRPRPESPPTGGTNGVAPIDTNGSDSNGTDPDVASPGPTRAGGTPVPPRSGNRPPPRPRKKRRR